jgi:phi13 family phage major tail protein
LKKGLKHPVFAPFVTEVAGQLPTYGTGAVVGMAIEANEAIEYNDAKLYADNTLAESDKSFKSGKLTIGIDDLSPAIKKLWFGTQEVSEGGSIVLKDAATYTAPYGGFGYYTIRQKNGVVTIEANWYYKTLWNRPNSEAKTKGDTVEFLTPKAEGEIIAVNDAVGSWHKEIEFATEAEAEAWLDAMAGIVTPDALTLSGSTPADSATGASKTNAVTLTFNNIMNQAQTVVLCVKDDGTAVAFTGQSWDATGKVLTLTHAAFEALTVHIVNYKAVDAYGQVLEGAFDFTTAS